MFSKKLFFKSFVLLIGYSAAFNSVPKSAATTLAFCSVFILLLRWTLWWRHGWLRRFWRRSAGLPAAGGDGGGLRGLQRRVRAIGGEGGLGPTALCLQACLQGQVRHQTWSFLKKLGVKKYTSICIWQNSRFSRSRKFCVKLLRMYDTVRKATII